jgi:hypothetical protein
MYLLTYSADYSFLVGSSLRRTKCLYSVQFVITQDFLHVYALLHIIAYVPFLQTKKCDTDSLSSALHFTVEYVHHHHQPINVPTAGAQAITHHAGPVWVGGC